MNTKQLLEKTTKNWHVKIICFVVAMMIYFLHQMSLLDKKEFSIPLEIQAEGMTVPISGYEKHKYVKISVRGKPDQIATATDKDFHAFVTVTPIQRTGKIQVPVQIVCSERIQLMEPLEIVAHPDNIVLELDEKTTKNISLKPNVSGDPAYGYKVAEAVCEPDFITVSGPSAVLSNISSLPLQTVSITNEKGLVSKSVKVINTNSYVKIYSDPMVSVNVSIVPEGMIKDISRAPISFENLSPDFTIEKNDNSVDFTVEGSLLSIEKFTVSNAHVFADCSFILSEGEYEIPVAIEVPSGMKITKQSLSSITITVVKKEVEVTENEDAAPKEEVEEVQQ